MNSLSTFLWFDGEAEEAMHYYLSIFKDAKPGEVTRYDEATASAINRPPGSVMTASFYINGNEFVALNGGPLFKFNESVSFVINCNSQAEIDYYWDKLTADGGEPNRCGWLKDKYGLSWQVVPAIMGKIREQGDAAKTQRMMAAMLKMDKLDAKMLAEA